MNRSSRDKDKSSKNYIKSRRKNNKRKGRVINIFNRFKRLN